MEYKLIFTLLFLLLSSSPPSSSSPLSPILSIVINSEGETKEDIRFSPSPLISRLLSRAQDDSAGGVVSLLSLGSLFQAVEELEKVDEERVEKMAEEAGMEGLGGGKRLDREGRKGQVEENHERENKTGRREGEGTHGRDGEDGLDSEGGPKFPKPPSIIDQIKEKLEEILQQVKDELNSRFRHVMGYYLPSNDSAAIGEDCAVDADLGSLLADGNRRSFLKMFDSWGKIPDGFLWGNINAPGMFEECLQMRITSLATVDGQNGTRTYRGRYCTISYRPNATEEERGRERAVLPSTRSGVSLATLGSPLPFTYGTCVPSTCTAEDLHVSLEGVLGQDGLEVTEVHCQLGELEKGEEMGGEEAQEEERVFTSEDKAFIFIVSFLGILTLLATIYEIIAIIRNTSSLEAIMNFGLVRNLGRIFTYEDGRETKDVITCLPMLRVVTMLWIIICHQYETNLTFIANLFDSFSYQEPAITQIVTNGWLSVDTFFCLTGLLLAYRLIPHLSPEDGYLSHVKVLLTVMLRRVVRLAPLILVVALFCASLLRTLAHGPKAQELESFSQSCVEHWWKDPLFINNYLFPGNEGDSINDCLSHCWYTAVDVQLLLLLPVIILPAMFNQLAGVAVLCALSVTSLVVPLAITLAYDLPPSPLHHVLGEKKLTYMTHIFMAPWCRMAPWLVGFWTGLILRTSWARRIRINKLVVFLGYVTAIALGLILVIGLLPYNRLHASHEVVSRDWTDYHVMSGFYGALARPTWALCIAWVVFTCHTGNAGFINKILSYRGWLPLARLTFPMYIVAPVVQVWWAAGLLVPTYYNYLSKLFESSGVFSVSLLLAIILACLVELPVISTFNLFLPSPARRQERSQPAKNSSANNKDKSTTHEEPKFSLAQR